MSPQLFFVQGGTGLTIQHAQRVAPGLMKTPVLHEGSGQVMSTGSLIQTGGGVLDIVLPNCVELSEVNQQVDHRLEWVPYASLMTAYTGMRLGG